MAQTANFPPAAPSRVQTMRAAAISAPGRLQITETRVPKPRRGEVLVQVEGCGVCASNIAYWEGKPWLVYPTAPGELGHEGFGRIAALGADVSDWEAGQRVSFLSHHAYAEYDVAQAQEMVALPDSLDAEPFPGEPIACAWNIFQRANITAGDTVGIVGIGFLGALLVQLANAAGAKVIAVARRPFAGSIATAFGADAAITAGSAAEIIEEVADLTEGILCNIVIEATGMQAPLDLATQLTRERGRLVIAGYHQDGPRQVDMQLWNWRGIDVINAHERDPAVYIAGMRAALQAVTEGQLAYRSLITHRLPLERLSDAFELIRERPDGFMKAIIVP